MAGMDGRWVGKNARVGNGRKGGRENYSNNNSNSKEIIIVIMIIVKKKEMVSHSFY